MSRKRAIRPRTPEICPVCGEDVPRNALACPECGADHNSGWKEDADTYGGVDLPEDDFQYDEFIKQEFGSPARPTGIKMIWWIAGVILVIALFLIYLRTAH
jgi:hypothetical protein